MMKNMNSLSKHLFTVIISIVTVAGCIYAGNVEMNDDILSGMSLRSTSTSMIVSVIVPLHRMW